MDRYQDISDSFRERTVGPVQGFDPIAVEANRLVPPSRETETDHGVQDNATERRWKPPQPIPAPDLLRPYTDAGLSILSADGFTLSPLTVTTQAAGTGAAGIVVTDTPATYKSFGAFTAAQIAVPTNPLNTTQGWVATSTRMGFASSPSLAQTNAVVFSLDDVSNNNRVQLVWFPLSAQWMTRRIAAGVGGNVASVNDTFAASDTRTIIMSWTATTVAISLAGAPFVSASNTMTPAVTELLFGSSFSSSSPIQSGILWQVAGTGVIGDVDAATIGNWGTRPPDPSSIQPAWGCKLVWLPPSFNILQRA